MAFEFEEKRKASQSVFAGKVINLRLDTVILPNGDEATRECVEHPGAVGVIAVDSMGRICLVRQYRYPVSEELWEIPAGKLNPGEDPLECAQRELLEEAGVAAGRWEKLYAYYTTPGFSNELMHLFLAQDLTFGENNPDEDEFLEASMVPVKEARTLLRNGAIKDSKTIIGLLSLGTTGGIG